jgi:S-(hydroxymethyl)glutathione dehydrogenase/alcohol dehydrogenase
VRAVLVEDLPGKPVLADIEVDEPGIGEVVIRVVACGVCHSDLHALTASHVAFPLPFVLGHEPAGVIEAVGAGVSGLRAGDHVVACLAGFCGHCAFCATGEPNRCTGRNELSRSADAPPRMRRGDQAVHQFAGLGGYAERLLVHQHNVVRIDPALPLARACLLGCGVVTGAGAVWNTAKVREGSTVAVIGAGGVGLAAIQAARISYARRIIAVDLDDEKLALAQRCGATDVVNALRDDPVAQVQALAPEGVDYTFEAIGRPATAQQGLGMTGPGGSLTMVGILEPNDQITVTGLDLVMGKAVQQSLMGSTRFVADIPVLVEHALAGRFDLDAMVSSERGLHNVPHALDELDAGRVLGRTVIVL